MISFCLLPLPSQGSGGNLHSEGGSDSKVMMVQSTTAMVVPVDPAHRLNEGQLLRYLQAHVAGFLPPPASLQVSQVINLEHAIFFVICSNRSKPLFCSTLLVCPTVLPQEI